MALALCVAPVQQQYIASHMNISLTANAPHVTRAARAHHVRAVSNPQLSAKLAALVHAIEEQHATDVTAVAKPIHRRHQSHFTLSCASCCVQQL